MAIKLGSNIPALQALRRLDQSANSLGKIFARLSSGMRITSASDDPAGLAVSSALNAKARIFNRAQKNVNDGTSALQIADGALSEITSLITRMSELAEQAATGTYSDQQRGALDKEYVQLDTEIRRIVNSTEFNGLKLLKGQKSIISDPSQSLVQLTNTTGAVLNQSSFANSADGRLLTYNDTVENSIKQLDLVTGETTTLVSGVTLQSVDSLKTSASGDILAFFSADDLVGQNAGGFNQLYVYNKNNGTLEQVSNTQGNEAAAFQRFSLSGDGSTLAFSTSTQYQDGGTVYDSPSYAAQLGLYLLDLNTGVTNEVNPPGALIGYENLNLSFSGNYLTFLSNDNITGSNGDNSTELFAYGKSEKSVKQLTVSTGSFLSTGSVTDKGEIFFVHDEDLTGENGSGYQQIFRYDYQSNVLSQFSHFETSGTGTTVNISPSGTHLVGAMNLNLDGTNPTMETQLYEYDFAVGEFEIRQRYDNLISATAIRGSSDSGQFIVLSTADPLGTNADGNNEFFLLRSTPDNLDLDLEAGFGSAGNIVTEIGATLGQLRGLTSFRLTTQDAARGALNAMRDNVSRIAGLRGVIGAGLSRLEAANHVLSSQQQEFRAAESRIKDVDIASESAELVRQTILQQGAAAILAQANLQPQLALQLLG